jgi:hypothetical protein
MASNISNIASLSVGGSSFKDSSKVFLPGVAFILFSFSLQELLRGTCLYSCRGLSSGLGIFWQPPQPSGSQKNMSMTMEVLTFDVISMRGSLKGSLGSNNLSLTLIKQIFYRNATIVS